MVDYKIKGTKIPKLSGVDVRLSHWGESSTNTRNHESSSSLVSYGSKVFNGEVWIICDLPKSTDSYHYMFKLVDIEKLLRNQVIVLNQPFPNHKMVMVQSN